MLTCVLGIREAQDLVLDEALGRAVTYRLALGERASLSTMSVSTFFMCASASARTPALAPRPMPIMIDMGSRGPARTDRR
jgi:hypothetical protein